MKKKMIGLMLTLAVVAGCTGCEGGNNSNWGNWKENSTSRYNTFDASNEWNNIADNIADNGDTEDGYIDAPSAYAGFNDTDTHSENSTAASAGSEAETYASAVDPIDKAGTYNSVEDVALYLDTYGCLPSNYMTKAEARDLGWIGGSMEYYAPGYAIGGDPFGNREGILPDGNYYECDIDTIGKDSRGAKRIIWSDDGRIYYTEDHYETFTLLYGEE